MIKQSVDQSIDLTINRSINQSLNQSINQLISKQTACLLPSPPGTIAPGHHSCHPTPPHSSANTLKDAILRPHHHQSHSPIRDRNCTSGNCATSGGIFNCCTPCTGAQAAAKLAATTAVAAAVAEAPAVGLVSVAVGLRVARGWLSGGRWPVELGIPGALGYETVDIVTEEREGEEGKQGWRQRGG